MRRAIAVLSAGEQSGSETALANSLLPNLCLKYLCAIAMYFSWPRCKA